MSCARLLDRGGIDHSPVGTLEKERNDPLIQKRRGVASLRFSNDTVTTSATV